MCIYWRKNQHTGIRGQVFAKLQKVNQACQSIWPAIDKEKINVKSESVSAGIPNNSRAGVSASSADKENNKKDIRCKRKTRDRIGRFGRHEKRQNQLRGADRTCITRSESRMYKSDDVAWNRSEPAFMITRYYCKFYSRSNMFLSK